MGHRKSLWLTLALAALVPGCHSTPDLVPVSVEIRAPADLGLPDGNPRSRDLYFARVADPEVYLGSRPEQLRVTTDRAVPGGRSIRRIIVAPGESAVFELGPFVHESFTHVGVFDASPPDPNLPRDPSHRMRVAEIPVSGRLLLILAIGRIQSLSER